MSTHSLQGFEVATIARSMITEAPYNPRLISAEAKRRLKRSLKKHKLVEPLVWNKRTGHLVGGHQRLQILDEVGGGDYELTVSAIDVDPEEEQRINVLLNQDSAMGEWDVMKLRSLVGPATVPEDFGFDAAELSAILGEIKYTPAVKPADAETIQHMKSMKNDYKAEARVSEQESTNYYAVLVFPKSEQRIAFCKKYAGDEYAEYVDGEKIARLLGDIADDDVASEELE